MLRRQTRQRCRVWKCAGTNSRGRDMPPLSAPGAQVRRRVPGPPASRSPPAPPRGRGQGLPGRPRPVSPPPPVLKAKGPRQRPAPAGTPPLTSARLEATAALRAHRQASGEGRDVPASPGPTAPATRRGVPRRLSLLSARRPAPPRSAPAGDTRRPRWPGRSLPASGGEGGERRVVPPPLLPRGRAGAAGRRPRRGGAGEAGVAPWTVDQPPRWGGPRHHGDGT